MKLSKILKDASDELLKMGALTKNSKGFPVFALFINGKSGEKITSNVNTKLSADTFVDMNQTKKHHAENKCCDALNSYYDTIEAVISLPPCEICFNKMKNKIKQKNVRIWNVWYLMDDIRAKNEKKYLYGDKNINVKKFKMKNNPSNTDKINYTFVVMATYYKVIMHKNTLVHKIDIYNKFRRFWKYRYGKLESPADSKMLEKYNLMKNANEELVKWREEKSRKCKK